MLLICPVSLSWVYFVRSVNVSETCFKILTPVANVIKLFWCNYIAIGITSVKIIGKYAASGVNYAQKKFYNIGHSSKCLKQFWTCFTWHTHTHTHTHTHQIKPLPNLTWTMDLLFELLSIQRLDISSICQIDCKLLKTEANWQIQISIFK